MKRIGVGVIGLGRIGWNFHVRILAEHAHCELVAVMDTEQDRRDQAKAEYGCAVHDDYASMLSEPGLDAVVIATPTHLHREMALHAFEHGMHVILEKPMALNLQDAEVVVTAARAAGKKLTVYQPHRLAAYFQQVHHIVRSGRIGELYWVKRALFSYARRNDWQSLLAFGGGMLSNYGAHGIDQVLGLIGFEVQRVFCDMQRVAALGDAEDVVKVVMESTDGVVGEVEVSQASALNPYSMLLWGTHGGISLDLGNNQLFVRWFDPATLPDKKIDERLASADRKYPSDDIEFEEERIDIDPSFAIDLYSDFADAIRTDRTPAIAPEESLVVMDLLDRCRESSGDIRAFSR